MDELTIPFLGARRAAWQYPFGDLLRAGAPTGGRQRLAGEQPRPARGASTSRSTGSRPGTDAASRSYRPASGSTSPTALTAYTAGQRLREPPRRGRPGDSRSATSPTWPSSTATRSPSRPTRSPTPGSSRPTSRANACSPQPDLTSTPSLDHPEVPRCPSDLTRRSLRRRPARCSPRPCLLAACSGTAKSDPDGDPGADSGAALPDLGHDPRAHRRHRLLHLVDVRRAPVAGLSVRLRLPAQHRSSPTSARACCAGTPTCRSRPGWPTAFDEPDADDLGLHDPRRGDVPRRHAR